jgi:hypothetical protein
MPRLRTTEDKVSDWYTVFGAVRDELTPAPFRGLIDKMTNFPVAEGTDAAAYASLVQSSMGIARLISANDRAAAVVAAMLTQSGVSRPQLDVIEGGEA